MKVRAEQLAATLKRGLAPIYLVHGEEPLQREEALDAIRGAARAAGFAERIVLSVDTGFDWSEFRSHTESLSLFSDRKILDLRMPGASPGNEGAKYLAEYAARPAEDIMLIASAGRIDRRSMSTKWFKSLDGAGVSMQVFNLDARELAGWIARRASGIGLELAPDAIAVLAERNEGNLLACSQELEKLRLLHPSDPVGVEEVLRTVADSSRFGAFDLVDSVLAEDAPRSIRILHTLREEGVEPLQILGSLTWAIRGVAEISEQVELGDSVDEALRSGPYGAWWSRKSALQRLTRTRESRSWSALLVEAEGTDRVFKGALTASGDRLAWEPNDGWDSLSRLCLHICGVNPLTGPAYT